MKGEFWKKIDEEIEREREQEENEWRFKVEVFKELRNQAGWLLYLKDIDEWLEVLNIQIEAMGFEGEPSMWQMGYNQGIRSALMRMRNHVNRILEEENAEG